LFQSNYGAKSNPKKNCVFAEKRKMKARLLKAKDRNEGISLEQAREKLGI
jgi:hypothetical protein